MTTILRIQDPFETFRMSQSVVRRRSKRLAPYDEEDGDFIFTRGSKRIKSQSSESETAPVTAVKRGIKSEESPMQREIESSSTVKKVKELEKKISTPLSQKDLIIVSKKRKTTRSSSQKNKVVEPCRDDTKAAVYHNDNKSTKNKSYPGVTIKSTVFPLPLSDTPVINRNKELRKKARDSTNRRSSLGLRGHRASSLIDSGHSAIPHHEVEIGDFYKYIEAEGLSEPRKMKQLLCWIGERCMGSKPIHGDPSSTAELAARYVKESLLKDFANKSEFSDWFNREEIAPKKIIKKPNPRNAELESNIIAAEGRLILLRAERAKWKELAKSVPQLPPMIPPEKTHLSPQDIDSSLLEPEQAAIFAEASATCALNLRKQASDRLLALQSKLEFLVDQFANGVYKLEQYQDTVSRVADRMLYLSARKLEEHYIREREKLGTRDLPMKEVLRSLGRILPERGTGR